MLVEDAQKEVRTVYIGGFFGQLVSSTLWLISAALATWVSPRAAILQIVCCGFFIFPLTQLMLHLSGRPVAVRRENPLHFLGMQVAFTLPLSMLLLVPVCNFRLSLFYPALMILLGSHYLPFTFLYGMRMFLLLASILIGAGVVIGMYFPAPFSIGGWVGGLTLLVFALTGRALAAPSINAHV